MQKDKSLKSHENQRSWLPIIVAGSILVVAISLVIAWTDSHIYVALGLAAIFALILFLKWPDLATLFVVGVLYSNAAVVANRFHGMPSFALYIIPALMVIPFFWHVVIHKKKIVITPVVYAILFLLAVQFAGVVNSIDSTETLSNVILTIAEGYFLYFLLTNVIRDKQTIIRLVWVMLLVGMFLGGLSLYQQATNSFSRNFGGFAQTGGEGFATGEQNLQGDVEQARLSGPIGEKNRYAQIMLMLVPIGMFYSWGLKSSPWRWLALAAGVISLFGAALAFSRGAAIAFFILVLAIGVMGFVNIRQFFIIVAITMLLGLAFPQYTVRLASIPEMIASLVDGSRGLSGVDSSARGRLTEMLAASDVWKDHPLVGVGTGMFRYHFEQYQKDIGIKSVTGTRQAHNLYLGIAADNGTLGLLGFGMIFLITLWNLASVRRYWRDSHPDLAALAAGFFLATLTYLATGIFLHLSYIRYMWLILGLSMALAYLPNLDKSVRVPQETAGE